VANAEWTVAGSDAGQRLDKFLAGAERLGSRARAATALERGKIYLNGAEAGIADAARHLSAGDLVRLWMDRPGSAKRKPRSGAVGALDIVYEDDELIVVNKPAGLLSVPLERKADASSVYELVEDRFRSHGKRRPLVVHRIDQDTSGLVVFAKHADAQRQMRAQFARREPERVYLAVVYGHPEPPSGTWRDTLVWDAKALIQKQTHPRDPAGMTAVSEYHTVERFREASLIEVRLLTRPAQPDPDPGAAPRAYPRRRGAVRVRARQLAHGPVSAPGPARVPARLRSPRHRAGADVRRAIAAGFRGPSRPPAAVANAVRGDPV
jgi:23S rRNA pseudouridine1911/1915/1917 synthase